MNPAPARPIIAPVKQALLHRLNIADQQSGVHADRWLPGAGDPVVSHSPIDGSAIATVCTASPDEYQAVVTAALTAFDAWRRKQKKS